MDEKVGQLQSKVSPPVQEEYESILGSGYGGAVCRRTYAEGKLKELYISQNFLNERGARRLYHILEAAFQPDPTSKSREQLEEELDFYKNIDLQALQEEVKALRQELQDLDKFIENYTKAQIKLVEQELKDKELKMYKSVFSKHVVVRE